MSGKRKKSPPGSESERVPQLLKQAFDTFAQASQRREESYEELKVRADRLAKHPDYTRYPTAGSYFKNLPPRPGETKRQAAGELLEQVGAKDLRQGDAALWHNHTNIVVNYGRATSKDVRDLTDEMANRVRQRFGVTLEPEVTYLE